MSGCLASDLLPFSHMLGFIIFDGYATRRSSGYAVLEIEGDIWTIPAARYKTDIDFEVPLSKAARGVLSGVTKLGKKGFVFTTNGSTSISGFSDWKERFDGHAGRAVHKLGPPAAGRRHRYR